MAMDQIKTAFIALLRVAFAGGLAWLLGLWLGKPMLVLAFVFGLLLFWHIFSGRWLSMQLKNGRQNRARNFSFLPLSYEDSQLRDIFLDQMHCHME